MNSLKVELEPPVVPFRVLTGPPTDSDYIHRKYCLSDE